MSQNEKNKNASNKLEKEESPKVDFNQNPQSRDFIFKLEIKILY